MSVHNHGPEEGPGLSCNERLVGDCIRIREARLHSLACKLAEALETAEAELADWQTHCDYRAEPSIRRAVKSIRAALATFNDTVKETR